VHTLSFLRMLLESARMVWTEMVGKHDKVGVSGASTGRL
jgi:hypothetical protein